MTDFQQKDAPLVLLSLSGDDRAYEALVTKYEKRVLAAAGSVTHNVHLAEDAAQDAFVTAWLKLSSLKDPTSFGVWVCRIAQNCARRMMQSNPLYYAAEVSECADLPADDADPAEWYNARKAAEEVHNGVARLPERVRVIIRLYYLEGKSISEIADYLGVTSGTVKSQLFEGRKKLRKDLAAMNENMEDTLTERVMKKVEELKRWQYRKKKDGFETVYREVLGEVENLPESTKKQSALADVLMRGWMWVTGESAADLLARIKEAAVQGKNEEVMAFVIREEAWKTWGGARVQWLRETAIPALEKDGFREAIGEAYLCCFGALWEDFRDKEQEMLGYAAKALEYLPSDTPGAVAARQAPKTLARCKAYPELSAQRLKIAARGIELHIENGVPRYWTDYNLSCGCLETLEWGADRLVQNLTGEDGFLLYPHLKAGESVRGDTFLREGETVETPAGRFEGCRLYLCVNGFERVLSWFREGVGIVRQQFVRDCYARTYVLTSFTVKGEGLLPLQAGNTWSYILEGGDSSLISKVEYTVEKTFDEKVILSQISENVQKEYDETRWEDMINAVTNDYYSDDSAVDVRPYLDRAEALAHTPMQKLHTKVAGDVMRRILDTNPEFNPDWTAEGCWNFFIRNCLVKKDGRVCKSDYNSRWSFEWKSCEDGKMGECLLHNFILDILSDNAESVWNDLWSDGYRTELKQKQWDGTVVKTVLSCEKCGEITVPAGTFADCLKVEMQVSGHNAGTRYRDGKHIYIFAGGVGLISAESEIARGTDTTAYLLTEYRGTGEGYYPLGDGLFRRYEAQNLTDGFVGWTEYWMVRPDAAEAYGDEEVYVLFSNQCGIRKKQETITLFSTLQHEQKESELYNKGERSAAVLQGKVNDIKAVLHLWTRSRDLTGPGEKAAAYWTLLGNMLKALGGGEIPEAFLAYYAAKMVQAAAGWMGAEQFEKGFRVLDEVIELYRKWEAIPAGTMLSVGDSSVYEGFSMKKGEPILFLPDGSREYLGDEISDEMLNGFGKKRPYNAMAVWNWAWFGPAKKSPEYKEKFAEYVEKARKLAEE